MKLRSTVLFASLLTAGAIGIMSFKPVNSQRKITTAATYDAQHISTVQAGSNYVWTWSVTNPNPGNGNNGTLQNLSHWSLAISDVMSRDNIVSVAYSNDGINWVSMPVSYAIDKSQSCYAGTVLKFDHGTTGSAPTYYQLVVNQDFSAGTTTANFKSGANTGCYNGTVEGPAVPFDDGSGR
jgi:hypothetical protein